MVELSVDPTQAKKLQDDRTERGWRFA